MRRLLYMAIVGGAACGTVAKQPDGGVDAPFPDALACTSPLLACGTCIDPMTDKNHCGTCDTACTGGESCTGGHCVDMVTSCQGVHDANPSAASGFYTLLDNTRVYCAMSHPEKTYEAVAMGQFDVATAGYDMVTVTDLQDADLGAAFIALFNNQSGVKPIAAWTSGNCCFKFDTGTMMLGFGGAYLTPATTPSTLVCGSYVAGTSYTFALNQMAAGITPPPLAANFFTTHPAAPFAGCGTSTNPAFFWKRH